ncbi:MAG: phosphoribosylanthranilate isomerase [Candidatus Omnitrophota bacterium]
MVHSKTRVKIKICGITNLEDAKVAVAAGCDALGFVFYKRSPRYISPEEARKIIGELPEKILKVGVFVNAKEKQIKRIALCCGLDALQFHGRESAEFCGKFKGRKIIKAFRLKAKAAPEDLNDYKVFAFLFDTFDRDKAGGTGKPFDWGRLKQIRDRIRRPLFLSGGLNEKNVAWAIKLLRPEWVDVSSSVQINPRKKSRGKIRGFIREAKILKLRA